MRRLLGPPGEAETDQPPHLPVTCKVSRQQMSRRQCGPRGCRVAEARERQEARLPAGGAGRTPVAPEVGRAARQLCLPADGERQGP
eukprot:10946192-Lingulodinium_polyedra.AAC.1